MYQFHPSSDYRYAMKKGMNGTDVAVLQLNLPSLSVDGEFGAQTEKAVRAFQRAESLRVDGVAGLVTQRRIALKRFAVGTAASKLPTGLIEGVANNESGFALACFSHHPSDAGFDIGVLQHSIIPSLVGSQPQYLFGYDARRMAQETGEKIRDRKDAFYGKTGAKTHRRAWELAVLYHNWPTAATNMALGGGPYKTLDNDAPQDWIIQASGGRLRTANQWVASYIERCCCLVTRWTP